MIDTKGFSDKASKNPEERKLYEEHDYITAYGKHTDLRIARDGHELAIGAKTDGGQDWDLHGKQQFNFLKARGLKPEHTLLDLGCGTGRLARQVVHYLEPWKYTGLDISHDAIETAKRIAKEEGWIDKNPKLIQGDGTLSAVRDRSFHMIFAHSVFTHLPGEIIEQIFADLEQMAFGEFCFTFKEADKEQRSGLKQWQFRPQFFIDLGKQYGFTVENLGIPWPAGQKTMVLHR